MSGLSITNDLAGITNNLAGIQNYNNAMLPIKARGTTNRHIDTRWCYDHL